MSARSSREVDHAALAAAGPWIDTHCHLDLSAGRGEDSSSEAPSDEAKPVAPEGTTLQSEVAMAQAAEVIATARAHGVERLVSVATDEPSARAAIAIAAAHDAVWATVGVHPHEATDGVAGLEALLEAPEVVAVGECGLDYHYDHSPRDVQREAFAAQIALAKRHDLALVVHTREAWDDTFALLDDLGPPERTIIHCFTGGPDEARGCLERGAWLSFSGIASFANADAVRAAVKLCPLDRLLVETDSPFLAPVPYRGKTNQPAWVPVVGAAVAQVRGVEPAVVAEAVWANAAAVFAR